MKAVETWDTIIVGAGVIGVSLALELRRQGGRILLVERSEPGREASHAAAGMLAAADPELPKDLQTLAAASAALYPEFVHLLEDESGLTVDWREQATVLLCGEGALPESTSGLTHQELLELEPALAASGTTVLLPERSLDPRKLMAALLKAAKHRGIELASGCPVTEILQESGQVSGVRTGRTEFHAPLVVNCAGAWASQMGRGRIPTRPVKGQMLSILPQRREVLSHVVRSAEVYLVPRSDGRIVIGSTVEEAGFDKRVDADTVQRLHQAAANLVPELGEARIHEAWAGLRPGTPDELPILGATLMSGYFVATGHFRNGILLAPVTAVLMSQLIRGLKAEIDISRFSPARFAS